MSDSTAQRHEMVLLAALAADIEEWLCPRCGRRIILRWPPRYARLVLEAGDETAIHVGGQGGMHLHAAEYSQEMAAVDTEPARTGLAEWRDWLRAHGVEEPEDDGAGEPDSDTAA